MDYPQNNRHLMLKRGISKGISGFTGLFITRCYNDDKGHCSYKTLSKGLRVCHQTEQDFLHITTLK